MKYIQNSIKAGDELVGQGLSLASNKVAPFIGPIVTNTLWKNKTKFLLIFISIFVFLLFLVEAITLQASADSRKIIDEHPPEHRDQIKLIPYGNPIGLERRDLVFVTSPFNVVRVINGVRDVHVGVDLVPSSTWFKENTGKSSKEAINRAIISGKVLNTIDSLGALCSYVTNDLYKVMYCHCDSFIAHSNDLVNYGDPLCFMGTTGRSTGVHVHIEIYQKEGNSWNRVDPTPFLFPQINQ